MSTYERVAGAVTEPIPTGVRPRDRTDASRSPDAAPSPARRHRGDDPRRLDGLDGLRALAIVAVVAFHLDPSWLPGGFLGVDVFFVVSGFLITTLLVREADATRAATGRPRIRLGRFWARRARRLLPALVVCLALSALVARVVHPDLLVHLGRQVAGALTFTTNWVEISAGSSYFEQTAPHLFLTLWSLAVEEQFYLVWPLVVLGLALAAVRPGTRTVLALAAALGSTALMAVHSLPGTDATRAYYGTDTHVMGLMLGAALAFTWASPGHGALGTAAWLRWRRPVVVASLAGLALLMWHLSEDTALTFRGGIALASLATTGLVAGLLPVTASSRWRRLMDAPVLTWVGRRSYGIYLWHWPVVLVVGLDEPTAPGTTPYLLTRLWAVLVTVALADLSYRFVEAPIRVWGFRGVGLMVVRGIFSPFTKVPRVVAGTSVVLLALAAAVVATAPTQTETERLLDDNAAYAAPPSSASTSPATAPAAGGRSTSLPSPAATPKATTTASPTATATAGATATGAATAAAGTAAKPATGTAAGAWAMPAGTEMDIFGDSLVVASIHALDYYFPGIRSDAKSNRQWSDGLAQLTAHRGDLRRAVVLDFGTNAGVNRASVTKALDLVGPDRMVVLVTVYGKASWIDAANADLAAAAAGRSNVVLADWHGAISQHPELLQSDGIHPSITGAHLFAKTIRSALAQLSEQHTGRKVVLPDLPVY